jgi:hypothetical protein
MAKLYLRATLLFCSLSLGLFSQEQDSPIGLPNDLDRLYVPGKNSILNSSYSISTASHESTPVKNIVKFNLTLLTRSTFAFFWEHPITKLTSFEAGLGATYGMDYMQKTFSEVTEDFGGANNNGSLKLYTLLQNSSYSGSPGPFVSGGMKIYYSDDAPEGSYISFNIRYSKYNLTYDQNNGTAIGGSPDYSVKNLCFNLTSGHQFISKSLGKGSFVQDLYMSVGLRKVTYGGFTLPSSNSSYNQNTYVNSGLDITQMQPVILLGYTLGLGF